jgi:Ran GTPase-activating protein (RanGAP) involved in mRNA processing and transport
VLAITLARNPNLELVNLSLPFGHSISIGRKEINTIATALTNHPKLHTLILKGHDVIESDVYSSALTGLASLLASSPSITTLLVDHTLMGIDNLQTLTQAINRLEKLSLEGDDLHDDAGPAIAALITRCTTLSSLALSDNALGHPFIHAIMDALIRNTTLKELDLENNTINQAGVPLLAAILSNNTGMTSIKLGNNPLGSETYSIIEALIGNTSLRELKMAQTHDSDQVDYTRLLQALAWTNHVETLKLSDFALGSWESLLAEAISFSGVKILSLSFCNLAGHHIASVIRNSRALIQIDLSWNNFLNTATEMLSALSSNTSIKRANLSFCDLSSQAAGFALKDLIANNATLKELNIRGNEFGQQDVIESITMALEQSNTTLEEITIDKYLAPVQCYSDMKEALTRNREIHRTRILWTRQARATFPLTFKKAITTVLMAADRFPTQLPWGIWDMGIISYLSPNDFGHAPVNNETLEEATLEAATDLLLEARILHTLATITGQAIRELYQESLSTTQEAESQLPSTACVPPITGGNHTLPGVEDGSSHRKPAPSISCPDNIDSQRHLPGTPLRPDEFLRGTPKTEYSACSLNTPLIDLSRCKLSLVDEVHLATSMALDNQAQELNLNTCALSDQGTYLIMRAASLNTHLLTLRMNYSNVNTQAAQALAAALLSVHTQLSTITLHSVGLGDDGCNSIMIVLLTNRTVNYLALGRNEITALASIHIAKMLASNTTLEALDLEGNHLGDKGTVNLAQGLARNHSLTSLHLSNNHFTARGAQALAASTSHTQTLLQLNISFNRIGGLGATTIIAKGLSLLALGLEHTDINPREVPGTLETATRQHQLRALDLSGCNLSLAIPQLAQAITTLEHLVKLALSDCQLGEAPSTTRPIHLLASALAAHPNLLHLDISRNRWQLEELSTLMQALTTLISINLADCTCDTTNHAGLVAQLIGNSRTIETLDLSLNAWAAPRDFNT